MAIPYGIAPETGSQAVPTSDHAVMRVVPASRKGLFWCERCAKNGWKPPRISRSRGLPESPGGVQSERDFLKKRRTKEFVAVTKDDRNAPNIDSLTAS